MSPRTRLTPDSVQSNVKIVHWNPRRSSFTILKRFPIGRRVNNFGDLLGPLVVGALVPKAASGHARGQRSERLLSVGSIMHLASEGDVVWGTGVNGKIPAEHHRWRQLDVRAVRGPLTREWLWSHRQLDVPEVYGDPALLLPVVYPELRSLSSEKHRHIAVVPNLHDSPGLQDHPGFINPRGPVWDVVKSIAQSEAVVGSSLHGIIVAESLGIPAVLVTPGTEPAFKYLDYAAGTGRTQLVESGTVMDAERLVRHMGAQSLDWDPAKLIAAFPSDLWGARS